MVIWIVPIKNPRLVGWADCSYPKEPESTPVYCYYVWLVEEDEWMNKNVNVPEGPDAAMMADFKNAVLVSAKCGKITRKCPEIMIGEGVTVEITTSVLDSLFDRCLELGLVGGYDENGSKKMQTVTWSRWFRQRGSCTGSFPHRRLSARESARLPMRRGQRH